MRLRPWVVVAVLVLAAGALLARGMEERGPAQIALQRHLRMPEGADASYPRLGLALRSRCWLLRAPGQPRGISLFTALPDLAFAPQRMVQAHELQPSFALIAGRTWDEERSGWLAADGSSVPLRQVRDSLEAACAFPADARLVLDLLLGDPAPGAESVAARLARGELPAALRIQAFSGRQGTVMRDLGRPPYLQAQRSYEGCLLAIDGPGWPQGWRVARLEEVGF